MNIKKQLKTYENTEDLIVNVYKNLDVICYLDYYYTSDTMDYFKVKKFLDDVKEKYDLILIDTSSKIEDEYTRQIFYNSNEILFIIEPNILGLKKAKAMLEVFTNDWRVDVDKLKFVINKSSIYDVSEIIIKEIFSDINIIGKIKYNDKYNLLINKNKNKNKKELKNEYKKIIKKIV